MAEVLNPDALQTSLDQLDGWDGTTSEGIAKEHVFADFAEAMAFVNRVAEVAEELDHHPDIHVSYNRVRLVIINHSAGGVTQTCVMLAERIDRL